MSSELPLGKPTEYPTEYAPSVLVAIPRAQGRQGLGLSGELPFTGVDIWNAYEVSWLEASGRPAVATAELRVPASSPNLVESKSLKLYLNSLNGTVYGSLAEVEALIRRDLAATVGCDVELSLSQDPAACPPGSGAPSGTCIDAADVQIDSYQVSPALLTGCADDQQVVEETLYSHLLKSNCPVTSQPDWATLIIRYKGGKIDHGALLRYVVSYRDHDEFHEQCVERVFLDLQQHCHPQALTVVARYTRRGGLDINPWRSNCEERSDNVRLWRQ
ncbi:MAG: 7-cyano-7-deazaguanine reductase [Pseudohongiellaceae bacterium]|jgi:7-cyano-7-deazaguanine reductase